MTDIAEPVFIQAFITKESIETLNKSILCRLARLDKTQFHAMLISPLVKRSTGKLRPLVSSYRSRIAAKQCNSVQNTRDLNARNPKGNGHRQTLFRKVVHAGQALDPATGGQRVHDKIHRPGQIGGRRLEQRQVDRGKPVCLQARRCDITHRGVLINEEQVRSVRKIRE